MRATARVGYLFLAPTAIVWLLTMVWPAIRLIVESLRDAERPWEPDGPSGANSFAIVFGEGYGATIGRALLAAALPLVVFVGLGLALGWATGRVSRVERLLGRWALAVPVMCVVPAAAAGAWLGDMSTKDSNAIVTPTLVGAMPFLGVAAVTVYAAAFRGNRPKAAVPVVTGLAVLSAIALGLAQFTVPALTGRSFLKVLGTPPTPLVAVYEELRHGAFPLAAAKLVVLFVPLAVLGVAAAWLLIRARLSVFAVGPRAAHERGAPPATVQGRTAWILLITGTCAAAIFLLLPWMRDLGTFTMPVGFHPVRRLPDTWLPALPPTLSCVALGVLTGYGIGVLRPLGRRSELLLLPLAPWLFVGTELSTALSVLDARGLPISQTPPQWLSVPVVVFFTLLFRAGTRMVWPAIALTAVVLWTAQAHDLFWRANAGWTTRDAMDSVGLLAYSLADRYSTSMFTPLPLVALAAAVAVCAQSYLDRLRVSIDPPG